MLQLIGLSGSLRKASLNTALLKAAQAQTPRTATLSIHSIRDIPLYDGDLETSEGVPAVVAALKDAIAAADGLLLATPEYNHSVPGVLKNAIDWLSRPPGDIGRVFAGKPVAIMGASPGRFGTVLAQNAWLPILRTLGAQHWTGRALLVAQARKLFDDDGKLVDDDTQKRIAAFMQGFTDFAQQRQGR